MLSYAPPPARSHNAKLTQLSAIKVCAVTTPEDAKLVTSVAPSILPQHTTLLLGMILWPGSRRAVSMETAREIAAIARSHNATPVGVFVDESIDTIRQTCLDCEIPVAQFHGTPCRKAWADLDVEQKRTNMPSWIDVREVSADASVTEATFLGDGDVPPEWTIYDAKGGGTGKPFDWNQFQAPSGPWLLAGGLDPDNVADAIRALRPSGLDVASGVAGPDKCAKDEYRLKSFLERAVQAYS